MINWKFFPKSKIIPSHLKTMLDVFEKNETTISSVKFQYGINEVLENVREDLEKRVKKVMIK